MSLPDIGLRERRRMALNAPSFVRGCIGKVRYSSKRQATSARDRIVRECPYWLERVSLAEMEPYKCSGHYHLGHPR